MSGNKTRIILPAFLGCCFQLLLLPASAQEDSSTQIQTTKELKKEERSEKVKKVFKFMSYINYSDRGYGKDFSGVEKYQPFQGKKISCVDIIIFKPFGCKEDSCPTKISKAQKFGNSIHFKSKEWFIRGDIFFREGDSVNPTLFADTEKQLWERNKFKDVKILIAEDSLLENSVSVVIFLQDRLSWTASAGYINKRIAFAVSTYNFFGLPHTFSIFAGINLNKQNLWAVGGRYKYENIQSSQINFTTQFVVEKLNQKAMVSFYRNFFSFKTKWAFDAKYLFSNTTLSLTGNLKDPSSFVKTKSHYYSLWMAYSVPVDKVMPCKDKKLKFVVGTKLNYINYRNRPFIVDRNYDEIFVEQQNYHFGIGLARWDFYLEKNAFYIDIAEYFPRGISTSFWVGPQIDEIYGKRTYYNLTANYGIFINKFGYLFAQADYSGYIKHRTGQQMFTRFNLDYVSKKVHFARHMFFRQIIKAGANIGFAVPVDRYFTINDANGIRGFYAPSLKGSRSITLSAECNLYVDKRFALSKTMLYAFCDMAWLSENEKKPILQSIFQYGVGLGFRYRSVDLGLPFLDFQFSFYPKGKNFGAPLFQVRLYDSNINAIQQNNMFYENGSNVSNDL
ncbi:MAG: hypothetical protein U0T77_11260 [Chitinophagales bacterium]